jgi:uncharacterized membrane protein
MIMTAQPFAIPAFLLLFAAVPLVLGLIPPNRFYGFRSPKTLSDDGIWYRVNRFAGLAIMLASCVYGAVAVLWPYDRAANDLSVWGLHLAAFVVPNFIGLSLAVRYSRSL